MSDSPYGVRETDLDARRAEPAVDAGTRPMYWSVRRELMENRFLYIAPLVVTAFVLFGTFISVVSMPGRLAKIPATETARFHSVLVKPFSMAPAPIMLAAFIIGMFYSLDALYGERRDRSILFWKSLPVSDRTTVLSKAIVPLLVLPSIAFALSVATQLALLVFATPLLAGHGVSPLRLWSEMGFFENLLIMMYGLTVHSLWFAPIYGWLMLISAWARRAPFLWAVLPLLAVAALERAAFNTWFLMRMLQYRLTGAMREAFAFSPSPGGHMDFERLSQLRPGRFLTSAGLWVGLVFAALCFAAAVRMRRNREPI